MKIAIITPSWLPLPISSKGGGIEQLIQYILNENEKKQEFDITVFSIYDKESVRLSKKYNCTKFIYIQRDNKIRNFYYYRSTLLLKKLGITDYRNEDPFIRTVKRKIKKELFEKIIIVNNQFFIKEVQEIYKGDIYYYVHNDKVSLKNKKENLLNFEMELTKCRKILCVSEFLKEQLMRQQTKLKNVEVLENCIDMEKFQKSNEIKKKEVIFLYSGRLIKEKGVKELIKAFKMLPSKTCKLLIVGGSFYGTNQTTSYMNELYNEVTEEYKERIVFLGFQKPSKMPEIYKFCDVLVVPTLYVEEAAGLIALEAQACGKPIIHSDSGGLPEYVISNAGICVNRDEEFVYNLSKAMNVMLENPKMRNDMGLYALKVRDKYNVSNFYTNFKERLK